MLSFEWNSTYEAQPGDGLSRGSIDDLIRQMGRGISERMSREHNFSYRADEDDGTHPAGKTTVVLAGDTSTMSGLTGMQTGAMYVNTEDGNIYVYTGAAWTAFTNASSVDHGSLDELDEDEAHPNYWLLDQDLTTVGSLGMDGNHVTVTGTLTGAYTVSDHQGHTHDIETDDALNADAVDTSKLSGRSVQVLVNVTAQSIASRSINVHSYTPSGTLLAVWVRYFNIGTSPTYQECYLGITTNGSTPTTNFSVHNDQDSPINYDLQILGIVQS